MKFNPRKMAHRPDIPVAQAITVVGPATTATATIRLHPSMVGSRPLFRLPGTHPGATYTITATATGAGFPVYGFEVAPLGAAGALVGTPLITNTTDTKLVSSKYVTRTSASISGSGSRLSFNWTAPAAGTGSVTFYGGFLLGDGDGGEGGDYVKTSTLTVTEASCTSPSQPGAISGNAAPCAGASVTYSVASVSGATSYSWSLPGGWSGSSTTNSITVTAGSTSGTVAVAAVNACGTSPSSAVGVVISTATTPTISTSGSTTFCQGGSVTLTSSAASGYSWSPGGQTTQSITVTSAGTYRVTVTNAGGCTASSSATTGDGKFRSDSHDHRGRTNDLLSGRKRYTDCFSRQQLSLESRWSNKPKHHSQRCRQLCSNRYECLRLLGDLCGDNCFGYPAGNRIHHCQWPHHLLSGRIGYLERVFRHVLPLESGW